MWIWQSDNSWKFDDTNQSTLPIAYATLVDEQTEITLPTTVFKLEVVEMMDQNGKWVPLRQITNAEIASMGSSPSEFMADTSGMPTYYRLVGNSMKFYSKVSQNNVTLENGLRVHVSRDVVPFTSSDTTAEPGFSSNFHRIVSVGMSLDYAIRAGMWEKVKELKKMLFGDSSIRDDRGMKGELQEAYGTRNQGTRNALIRREVSNI